MALIWFELITELFLRNTSLKGNFSHAMSGCIFSILMTVKDFGVTISLTYIFSYPESQAPRDHHLCHCKYSMLCACAKEKGKLDFCWS